MFITQVLVSSHQCKPYFNTLTVFPRSTVTRRTRQRVNVSTCVPSCIDYITSNRISLKRRQQRRMTSAASSLSIVRLAEHQIAIIPLINHPSLSLLEEDHHHPVHPPHSETRSFPTVQQASTQTPYLTMAQVTTTTRGTAKGYGSNVPHHPLHPSPISQPASCKGWAHLGPLHRDHLC